MIEMAERYQSDDRTRRYGARRGYGQQAEQFQSDYDDERRGQMGDNWRNDEFGAQQAGWQSDDRFERDRGRDFAGSHSGRFGEDRFDNGTYRSGRPVPGGERSYASFTGSDFGGGDFSRGPGQERWPSSGERGYGRSGYGARSTGGPDGYGAGSWLGANHGEWRERNITSGRGYPGDDRDERGFFERAGEAIGRWFGDDDESGRPREGYRGHGPAGYTRTDERIREDASERLTDDWAVDARKIELTVSSGEITLNGTVPSRDQKRRAEDLVENVSGVKHVQNNLRVEQGSTWDRNNSGETTGNSSGKTTTSR
jgi:hypothetical protein